MGETIAFLTKGGWILVPILLTSVVALAVFLERLVSLRPSSTVPEQFSRELLALLQQGRVADAKVLCERDSHAYSRIVGAFLKSYPAPATRLREIAEERGKQETSDLERPIEIVGTCSTIAPLLGLFGTVVGMIEAFRTVEEFGVDPNALAGGIWQALITTAVGLGVAIPAFVFYKILLARLDGIVVTLEAQTSEILSELETLHGDAT